LRELTERQKSILSFIENFVERNGYPPSVRDIARHFRITPRGVLNHLRALEKKGYIDRKDGRARSIKVLKKLSKRIPILGRIRAGEAREAIEYLEDHVEVPNFLLSEGFEHFVLRVQGDSMIGDHICDGDYVVVRKQDWASNGDIVVALVDNEVTLKRFYQKGDAVELRPSNPAMSPMFFKADEVRILGKVVGIFRKI